MVTKSAPKKYAELILCGQRMSNWLYNIAQMDKQIPGELRAQAKELQLDWDKVKDETR